VLALAAKAEGARLSQDDEEYQQTNAFLDSYLQALQVPPPPPSSHCCNASEGLGNKGKGNIPATKDTSSAAKDTYQIRLHWILRLWKSEHDIGKRN
jgi:hypothetical protein